MTLPRYFIRETVKLTAAIIGGLFVIYLTMRFATYLGEAAEGKVAPQHIARIVGLKMLVSIKDLLPMSLFIAAFGAITRLQQTSEWTAMRAAGLTHGQLLRPLFIASGTAAIIVGVITLLVGPRAELELRELAEQTENEATIAGVKAGRFREFSGGSQVFYAESISDDERLLEHPFVRSGSGDDANVLRAAHAFIETDRISRDRFAVFENGASYDGVPGSREYTVTDFDRYAVRIENREPTRFGAYVGFLFTSELFGREKPAYGIEFQWRLALPICTFLTPALAVLIALSTPRGRWYLGLITAVSAYFAYTNVLGVGRAMMRKEVLSPLIGLWPVHLLFAATLVLLLMWHRRRLRLGRGRPRQELLRA